MSNSVVSGIYAGLGIADSRARRRLEEEERPAREARTEYQQLLNRQLGGQLNEQDAMRDALSPQNDGLTPIQRQMRYFTETGQADKANSLINDLLVNAERLSKTAGTGRAGVDFLNQQLPELKLEYQGSDDDGWEWIKSADNGFLGYHLPSGQTKHIPFPKPTDTVPKTVKYNKDGFETTEIYRPDGTIEIVKSPIKKETKADKPKDSRRLFIKVDETGEIVETRSVNIYDDDDVAEANAEGFRPQSSQSLLMGDPMKALVGQAARSAMGPAKQVQKTEAKIKAAEGKGKKVVRRGVDKQGRRVVQYEDGTIDYEK